MIVRQRPGAWIWTPLILSLGLDAAWAERLPIRTFGLDEGLPSSTIACIVPDRKGFVWFCTTEGLARFDGTRFRVYTPDDGLPHASVTAFLQAPDGSYWVGTARGLARFEPDARVARSDAPLFVTVPPSGGGPVQRDGPRNDYVFDVDPMAVYSLHMDPTGVLWCGTGAGLFRVALQNGTPHLVASDVSIESPNVVDALLTDRRGRLWIGASSGLYRRSPDGTVVAFGKAGFLAVPGVTHNVIKAILEDREGRIWVGTDFSGVLLLSPDAEPGPRAVERAWFETTEVAGDRASSLVQADDGSIWWVGLRGLKTLRPGRRGWEDARVQAFGTAHGLPRPRFDEVARDPLGNLWLGGESTGAVMLMRGGLTSYTEADGLASRAVHAITEDDEGLVVVTEIDRGPWHHNRFDGRTFTPLRAHVLGDDWGWGWSQLTVRDRQGRWWVPTGRGVYRSEPRTPFLALSRTHLRHFESPFGTNPHWAVFRLFLDSADRVWAGTVNRVAGLETPDELAVWEPATDRFAVFPTGDERFVPAAFAEDRAGGIWIGGLNGGLRRADPRARRLVDKTALAPGGRIRALLVDARGRLWVGTSDAGVVLVATPEEAVAPTRTWGTADGLASNDVWSLVEDTEGRIYMGHARGVDVLAADGTVSRRISSADGLAPGTVWCAHRDRTGALWFGTLSGLSRLVPSPAEDHTEIHLGITAVSIGGRAMPIDEAVPSSAGPFDVPPGAPALRVEFVGLGAASAEHLRYQSMVEGLDTGWGRDSAAVAVDIARPPAGEYRLLVRALTPNGTVVSEPATVRFRVRRPFWAESYFILATTLLAAGLLYAWHRTRVAHAVAVERMRLRIARDLHDELGSNLARLAILGESAKVDAARIPAVLSDVADTSRRLVGSLGEVVWFVDPRKDDLPSVLLLLAAHGRELFEPQGVRWNCVFTEACERVRLDADHRRHLYLLLKEAITNAATHAQASTVELSTECDQAEVRITLRDDGRGLAAPARSSPSTRGNGVANMHARATALGARLTIDSSEAGTVVSLAIPRLR